MSLTVYSVPRSLASARKVLAIKRGDYPAGLDMREVTILQMIADGILIKEIAQEAKLTYSTVGMILISIRKKTESLTTYQAVAWGFRNKVIL